MLILVRNSCKSRLNNIVLLSIVLNGDFSLMSVFLIVRLLIWIREKIPLLNII